MIHLSTSNFLKWTACGATATIGFCHFTESRDPLVEKINQIAKGVVFASAFGLWYLGTRPPIPAPSSSAASSTSVISSSIVPTPPLAPIPSVTSSSIVPTPPLAPIPSVTSSSIVPTQVAANKRIEDLWCLRDASAATKERIKNCVSPIIDKIPEGKWGKIVHRLNNTSDPERDDIVDCLRLILDTISVDKKIDKLFSSLAKIPKEERRHCVFCALSVIDRLKKKYDDGRGLGEMLSCLSEIPQEKRESAINSTLHFFGDKIKYVSELTYCFKVLAQIPDEQQEKIVRSAYLFSSKCDGAFDLASICQTLAQIPEEQREKIITHALPFVDRLEYALQIRHLLSDLAKIPNDKRENVAMLALHFIDRLKNYEAVRKMLEILAALPDEQRQLAVDDALLFSPDRLKNEDLSTFLEMWNKTPVEKRENIVQQMLHFYNEDSDVVNANHQDALQHLQVRIEMYKYFTETQNPWNPVLQVALPVSVRNIIQYLTSKGAIPEDRCIVCDDMEMFTEQFDKNKANFDKPFCFVVQYWQPETRGHARHWTNIVVQNNTVICTDSVYRNQEYEITGDLNDEQREEIQKSKEIHKSNMIRQHKIIRKALPPGFHLAPHTADSPMRQFDHSGCWVFAVRDAVELLRMKEIQSLLNSDNQVTTLPPALLKSMQSLLFFKKNASPLQQVVTSHRKGTPQPQTLGQLLSRHTKTSGDKERNSYIDDRREKYMNLVAEKIRQELPSTKFSLEQFSRGDILRVVLNYIREKNIRGLQFLLPAVGVKLPMRTLFEGISLVNS